MTTRTWIIITIVMAAVAYASGRYMTEPTIITKNVEVIKEVEVVKRDVRTVIKEVTSPDGTRQVDTVIEDKTRERTRTDSDRSNETIVTNEKPQWKVGVSARTKIFDLVPVYGGTVERRIIGPIFVGINGWTDSSFGISVGLEF